MTEEQRRMMERAGAALPALEPAGLRLGFMIAILQMAEPDIDPAKFRDLIVDLRRACTSYLRNGDLSA